MALFYSNSEVGGKLCSYDPMGTTEFISYKGSCPLFKLFFKSIKTNNKSLCIDLIPISTYLMYMYTYVVTLVEQ